MGPTPIDLIEAVGFRRHATTAGSTNRPRRAYKGRAVKLLIADREIRVIDANGELLRELLWCTGHP